MRRDQVSEATAQVVAPCADLFCFCWLLGHVQIPRPLSVMSSSLYNVCSLPSSVRALNLNYPSEQISYKQLAEAFVSGHAGSDGFMELSILLLTSGMWMAVWRIARAAIMQMAAQSRNKNGILVKLARIVSPPSLAQMRPHGSFLSLLPCIVLEWSILVVPVVVCMTLGADYAIQIFCGQLCAIAAIVCATKMATGQWIVSFRGLLFSTSAHSPSDAALLTRLNTTPKLFLTNYRCGLMLYTSVAILAVDFVVFPRRFCKSETFGVGMMDGGVGSFIISHALTSMHARGATGTDSSRSLFGQLAHILRSILPLLVLGVARLFTIKGLEYQEHVSEYGVHWNFFFTLAAVAVLSGTLSRWIRPQSAVAWGAALILAYQAALSFGGLTEYIMTAPRVSYFSANKEGIFSSIGYFSLYLAAVRVGHEVLAKEQSLNGWRKRVVGLFAVDLLLWVATLVSSSFVQLSSRRMVNLTYALWMMASSIMQLLQCIVLEMVVIEAPAISNTHSEATKKTDEAVSPASMRGPSLIIDAINKNSLPFFLLCNLCTGAINLSMHTIFASNAFAMTVVSRRQTPRNALLATFVSLTLFLSVCLCLQLCAYTLVTCMAVVFLDYRGLVIKL